ncbi:MAG: hypothetical protein SV375_15485 [Thermodesulfobacteriota bacterium]|nr:hypothetical protein [Thermodesulfobacteriota bacterium]
MVYDHETLAIDYEKTEKLRQAERKKRLGRGKPYEEFEKEWLLKKPPEEILGVYGSWPDAKLVAPIMRI